VKLCKQKGAIIEGNQIRFFSKNIDYDPDDVKPRRRRPDEGSRSHRTQYGLLYGAFCVLDKPTRLRGRKEVKLPS